MDELKLDSAIFSAFAEAAEACGTDRFYRALLDAVGQIIGWETCGVIQFSKYSIPQYILTRNVPPHEAEYYLSGFYRLDPYFQYWRRTGNAGVISLSRVADTVDPGDYKTSFQPRTGMMDEIGVICPKFQGVADDLFFLRSSPYAAEELAQLDVAFPLIRQLHALNIRLSLELLPSIGSPPEAAAGASCFAVLDQGTKTVFASPGWENMVAGDLTLSDAVASLSSEENSMTLPYADGYVTSHRFDKNFALSPMGKLILVIQGETARTPLSWDEVLASLHGNSLTPRELDICGLILRGHPTAGIASVLDISPGTVKNHRKRIYRKLDITSERELFLTVLSLPSQNGPGDRG